MTSRDRKFRCTNAPSVRPTRSFFAGTIAVCGIGMPSGWRNSAVTANQSARPPTIAASIVARTMPSHGIARLEAPRDDEQHRRADEQQRRATLHRVERGLTLSLRPASGAERSARTLAPRRAAVRTASGRAAAARSPAASPRRHLHLREVDESRRRAAPARRCRARPDDRSISRTSTSIVRFARVEVASLAGDARLHEESRSAITASSADMNSAASPGVSHTVAQTSALPSGVFTSA